MSNERKHIEEYPHPKWVTEGTQSIRENDSSDPKPDFCFFREPDVRLGWSYCHLSNGLGELAPLTDGCHRVKLIGLMTDFTSRRIVFGFDLKMCHRQIP